VGIGQGQASGETGAEVGTVDVGGAGLGRGVGSRAEIFLDPGVAKIDIVERRRPVERDRRPFLFLSYLPPVVDDGGWEIVETRRE
jgi:hypothetical protein